jgi:hypothetical protein
MILITETQLAECFLDLGTTSYILLGFFRTGKLRCIISTKSARKRSKCVRSSSQGVTLQEKMHETETLAIEERNMTKAQTASGPGFPLTPETESRPIGQLSGEVSTVRQELSQQSVNGTS